jgi:hypothetical protein
LALAMLAAMGITPVSISWTAPVSIFVFRDFQYLGLSFRNRLTAQIRHMRVNLRKEQAEPSFRSLFCESVDCLPQDYGAQAFWRFLPWHVKPVAFVIRKLNADFFIGDFQFIHAFGQTRNMMEAIETALDFRDSENCSLLRTWLRVRVNERRAVKIAQQYFRRQSSLPNTLFGPVQIRRSQNNR